MTHTKHTPGPWQVRQWVLDGRFTFPVLALDGSSVCGVNARSPVLAGLGKEADERSRTPRGQPEAEANARLIAAAPLMKGQLQTTIDALEAAIQLFIRKEDSEAFGALKGIIAGNEMALAKAETPDAG